MGFSVRTGAGAPNLRVPPRSCGLDFGLDFLFAHPGGSVYVGFVIEHISVEAPKLRKKCVKNNTRKNNYLFIDEVQLCNSFEKALNSLHATEKYDIYVTGSNAFLLSSDLATLFTGRTFEIQVFPFSFAEYVKYYKPKNPEASFDAYLKEGGMAGAFLYKTENEKFRYVNEDVFNTLVIRDIVKKYKIRNKVFLEKLIDFLMDNVGYETRIYSACPT